jgi:hypothetical protein
MPGKESCKVMAPLEKETSPYHPPACRSGSAGWCPFSPHLIYGKGNRGGRETEGLGSWGKMRPTLLLQHLQFHDEYFIWPVKISAQINRGGFNDRFFHEFSF